MQQKRKKKKDETRLNIIAVKTPASRRWEGPFCEPKGEDRNKAIKTRTANPHVVIVGRRMKKERLEIIRRTKGRDRGSEGEKIIKARVNMYRCACALGRERSVEH